MSDEQSKWNWMIDWCEYRGLAAAKEEVWILAEEAYEAYVDKGVADEASRIKREW